ncbi:MAG TPA: SIS domain-containing protein [Gemmatimonadaceae bacterium]|nr:SIS domain-containing protein [Gemmatimonadaceae bacterium]
MTRRKEYSAQSDLIDGFVDHFRAHEKVVSASAETLASSAAAAGRAIIESLEGGGKVICFGNGGSATQASHLAGELVGRFRARRRPHPAVSLASDAATITCIGNDFGYPAVFDRQMAAFAQPGDVAIGLTTSGKSENVISAFVVARAKGAVTVALTGSAGLVGGEADHLIAVPSTDTAHIQEIHLMVLHAWCVAIDEALP